MLFERSRELKTPILSSFSAVFAEFGISNKERDLSLFLDTSKSAENAENVPIFGRFSSRERSKTRTGNSRNRIFASRETLAITKRL